MQQRPKIQWQHARDLTDEIGKLERRLKEAKKELADLRVACNHDWLDTKHHPNTEEWKHLTHPDPEKERRLAMGGHPPTGFKVGEQEHWTRTCRICGLTERTTKTEAKTKIEPKW